MEKIRILEILLFFIVITGVVGQERIYSLRLQPELDTLDIESYLRNDKFLNLQIKCVLYNGPCDVVGRWAKPRVKAGLLGECLKCTEKQKGWLNLWLERLIKDRPELYRAAVGKFLVNSGIEIPEEELTRIKETLEKNDEEEKAPTTT